MRSHPRIEPWRLRIIEKAEDITAVEELQRVVWPGNETEVVPLHILVTLAQNGGLVIGAYDSAAYQNDPGDAERLVGFVSGAPGLYYTADGARAKHCSLQMGVHPNFRDQGIGFTLKRAQWQMVRNQGLDLITWTFDPLQSRNAYLNISLLGAVCSTYKRDLYGKLEDDLNRGMLTDRFQVDWWVNSKRVNRRLSRKARPPLDLAHFLSADAHILNPTKVDSNGWPRPDQHASLEQAQPDHRPDAILLVEIPSNILALRSEEPELANEWRLHTRTLFETLFTRGYLITDFIYLPGSLPRSFYVLSHGESTL
jgi:predicted GNAT superfamily acetyltransferase